MLSEQFAYPVPAGLTKEQMRIVEIDAFLKRLVESPHKEFNKKYIQEVLRGAILINDLLTESISAGRDFKSFMTEGLYRGFTPYSMKILCDRNYDDLMRLIRVFDAAEIKIGENKVE